MPAPFSVVLDEFKNRILADKPTLLALLDKRPNDAYKRIMEFGKLAGSLYGVDFQVHFPVHSRLFDLDSYGTENLSLVFDKFRKRFPIPKELIREKVIELFDPLTVVNDAYMYEAKEGLRAVLIDGRIDILPGSVHFWCAIDARAESFGNWLMTNVYHNDSVQGT